MDLRKVVEVVWRESPGGSVHVFGVGISPVERYAKLAREDESLAPKKARNAS